MDNYSNRIPGPVERALKGFGAVGSEHAVPSRKVKDALGVESVRLFREMVEQERTAGGLILANSRGLFLPDAGDKGREEIKGWVRLMTARIAGAARTLKEARGILRRVEGQTEISEEDDAEAADS